MSITGSTLGRPGVTSAQTIGFRFVSVDGQIKYKPGGGLVKGAKARDVGNTDETNVLRPGLMMAKHATDGDYAPFVLGVLQQAQVATDTSITLTAAQAAELVRRVGSTGSITLIGPPSAAGTVATFTETYSAVNTTTGVVTVSALNANLIAGSFVAEANYTAPKTLIGDDNFLRIPLVGTTGQDTDWPRIPMEAYWDVTKILDYPSDSSLKTWVKEQMSTLAGNKFSFSDSV